MNKNQHDSIIAEAREGTYAEAEIANQCADAIRSGSWKECLK